MILLPYCGSGFRVGYIAHENVAEDDILVGKFKMLIRM